MEFSLLLYSIQCFVMDVSLQAVEWVICVWQRLNDGLAKLGLLDLVFGPCIFLLCPVEVNKPKVILR